MDTANWNKIFGEQFTITLTDTERRYLGLSVLSDQWITLRLYNTLGGRYTRATVFFDDNVVVKVIRDYCVMCDDGSACAYGYSEYDTHLLTQDREQLLPLTSRGKPKPITISNLDAVTPFGCTLFVSLSGQLPNPISLRNLRANKDFPIGEWDKLQDLHTEADFHAFMDFYIATCREDYFAKLHAFQTAKKVTVKYRPGDIFRMELDRTRYCYGIITGTVKQLKAMADLPEDHSLQRLMMVPIMIRRYELITENPNLTAENLRDVPLGRMSICADNDIIWGTHTVVDHRPLTPKDLEFHFVCTKILHRTPHTNLFTQDFLMHHASVDVKPYSLYVEWGFAQTQLSYEQLSETLKAYLAKYSSPHGGVCMIIDPHSVFTDESYQTHVEYQRNLLNPHNRAFLNEIFTCLGLPPDASFDQFAERFGGLTLQQIADRINK